MLGNIGVGEILIIVFVAFLLFGEKMPAIARSLGKSISEINKSLKDTSSTILKSTPDETGTIDKAPRVENLPYSNSNEETQKDRMKDKNTLKNYDK